MIPHMDTGLVNIRCPAKGLLVPFQHQRPLSPLCAEKGRIKAVKPRPYDHLIVSLLNIQRKNDSMCIILYPAGTPLIHAPLGLADFVR